MSYTVTRYTCMECEKTLNYFTQVKKCSKCGMDLCLSCYNKNKTMCAWCYSSVSAESLGTVKIANVMLALSPLFAFLVPAPMPIIIGVFQNIYLLIPAFVYMGIFLIVFGMFRAAALKKMAASADPGSVATEVSSSTLKGTTAPEKSLSRFTRSSATEDDTGAGGLSFMGPKTSPASSPTEVAPASTEDEEPILMDFGSSQPAATEPEQYPSFSGSTSIPSGGSSLFRQEPAQGTSHSEGTCPNCGEPYEADDLFCTFCGQKLQ